MIQSMAQRRYKWTVRKRRIIYGCQPSLYKIEIDYWRNAALQRVISDACTSRVSPKTAILTALCMFQLHHVNWFHFHIPNFFHSSSKRAESGKTLSTNGRYYFPTTKFYTGNFGKYKRNSLIQLPARNLKWSLEEFQENNCAKTNLVFNCLPTA